MPEHEARQGIAIFGVGSPLVADLEEGLHRAGTPVAAAVANVSGEVFLLDRAPLIRSSEVTSEITTLPYLVPLFTPAVRNLAVQDAIRLGFETPARFFDPTIAVPRSLAAEPVVCANTGVTFGARSSLGSFVLINRGASIGHDAGLDRFVSVGPNATLAGYVSVGEGATIAVGAVVLPRLRIGAHATVAAGSVVTRDVPDRCLVMGSPARIVRDDLEGFEAETPRALGNRALG
jgi:UDP-3-O-[3-hydroxymyristoyl] glucosamine N-acyltransferase